MENVVKVFPLIPKFFGEKGLSISQANARKNNNTNYAEQIVLLFEKQIYHNEVKVINASVVTDTTTTPKIFPSDYDLLVDLYRYNEENAVLGHGIKLLKQLQAELENMTVQTLAERTGVELPVFNMQRPSKKSAVWNTTIEQFMNLDSIEAIVACMTTDALQHISSQHIINGLQLEAVASALGKQLTKKESFLKRLLSAQPEKLIGKKETAFGLVIEKEVLAYSKEEVEEFQILQTTLYSQYTKVQSQVNGTKKALKDAVRKLQQRYNEEFLRETEEYNKVLTNYNSAYSEALARLEVFRNRCAQELADLKILSIAE